MLPAPGVSGFLQSQFHLQPRCALICLLPVFSCCLYSSSARPRLNGEEATPGVVEEAVEEAAETAVEVGAPVTVALEEGHQAAEALATPIVAPAIPTA